jgi:predicted secreted protein
MPNIGYGVTLAVSDAAPAVTPINVIGQITNFTPPSATRDIIDVTSSDSPDFAREFIAGLIDYGEAGAEINWDIGNASDVLLKSLLTERAARTWRATFTQYTPARTMTFTAFLTGYEPEAPLEDKMMASLTLKVTGNPVIA